MFVKAATRPKNPVSTALYLAAGVAVLVAGDRAEAASIATGYDFRAMMAQPSPFARRAAPQAPVQAAPAPVRPAPGETFVPRTSAATAHGAFPRSALPQRQGKPVAAPVATQTRVTEAAPAGETVKSTRKGGVWRLELQNEDRGPLDGFMGNSDTGHLTWGWRASYTPDAENPDWFKKARGWFNWPGPQWRAQASYGLQQTAYAKSSIRADNNYPERPYAGALLFTSRVNLTKPFDGVFQQNDFLELGVGLVGPASGAEVIHRVAHSAAGKSTRSWRGEIKSEPVILAQYEKGLRTMFGSDKWFNVELFPYAGAALGNMTTYASTGTTLRIGRMLKEDSGPPRMRHLMVGENFPKHGDYWTWSLFAGAEYRAIGFNIFTDGNTYSDTSDVTTKPFVYEFQMGAEVGYGAYRMTLMQVYRSEEFEEQDGQDRFIRLGLSAYY